MVNPDVQVAETEELASFVLADGVVARPFIGQHLMFNILDFEPHAIVPIHDHPHEQLGLVLKGSLLLVAPGVRRELGPGSLYSLPGGTRHEGRAGPDGCRVLDVFHPVREDYRALLESTRTD